MSYEVSFALFCFFGVLFAGIMVYHTKDQIRLYFYRSICLIFLTIALLIAGIQAGELGATISYFIILLLATTTWVSTIIGFSSFIKETRKAQKKDLV